MQKKILAEKKQDYMVFYVSLPDKEVYKRSYGRKAGSGNALFKMFDEDNIIKKRIAWHKDQVSKTVAYFDSLGKLTKINGNQSIEKVQLDILRAIKKHLEK